MDNATAAKRQINIISNIVIKSLGIKQNNVTSTDIFCDTIKEDIDEKTNDIPSTSCSIIVVDDDNKDFDKTINHLDNGHNTTNEHMKEDDSQPKEVKEELTALSQENKKRSRKRKKKRLDDDEDTIFNYMTGLYEKVKKSNACSEKALILGDTETVKTELTSEELILKEEVVIIEEGTSEVILCDNMQSATVEPRLQESSNTEEIRSCIPVSKSQDIVPNVSILPTLLVPPDNPVKDIVSDTSVKRKSVSLIQNAQPLDNYNLSTHTFKREELTKRSKDRLRDKFTCQICPFKTSFKQKLLFHLYDIHLQDEYSLKFKCKICHYESNDKNFMFSHEKLHDQNCAAASNGITTGFRLSKNVEIMVLKKKVESDTEECEEIIAYSDEENSGNNLRVQKVFKCFDCAYEARRKVQLREHALRHLGSKFRCTQHVSITRDCPKCTYKACLPNKETKSFICETCGYRTYNTYFFREHKSSFSVCSKRNPPIIDLTKSSPYVVGIYKCFDCDYVAKRQSTLTRHAVRHLGSKFKCYEHIVSTRTCGKCIYRTSLLNAQNKVIINL